jgi:hypothetical protein
VRILYVERIFEEGRRLLWKGSTETTLGFC